MRDWIVVHTSVLDSDTWADLGEYRLAWVVTLILAAQQSPEGEFDSAAKLIRLLTKEDIPFAMEAYDEMTRAGALEDEDGRIRVHGWDRWQRRYRGPSDDPDREAARKREAYWREKAQRALESPDASGPSPEVSGVSPDSSEGSPTAADRGEERRGEEIRGDKTGVPPARAREGDGDEDALDTFYLLTMTRPWGRSSGSWITELQDGYGIAAVQEALAVEWKAEPQARTLISRADARLAREAERRRTQKAKEPRRARPTGRTDEERAILAQMIEPEVQG